MPYIPKEHEKYDLLPFCRKTGGEVFEYPSCLVNEVEDLIGTSSRVIPFGYKSYEAYFEHIDDLIKEYSDCEKIILKLKELCDMVKKMNRKEEWSVLKYIGPTTDATFGLTYGKNYYWPTRKDNSVYSGVVDDEEFTAYQYPTDSNLWEILEDPTGMAYKTLFAKR